MLKRCYSCMLLGLLVSIGDISWAQLGTANTFKDPAQRFDEIDIILGSNRIGKHPGLTSLKDAQDLLHEREELCISKRPRCLNLDKLKKSLCEKDRDPEVAEAILSSIFKFISISPHVRTMLSQINTCSDRGSNARLDMVLHLLTSVASNPILIPEVMPVVRNEMKSPPGNVVDGVRRVTTALVGLAKTVPVRLDLMQELARFSLEWHVGSKRFSARDAEIVRQWLGEVGAIFSASAQREKFTSVAMTLIPLVADSKDPSWRVSVVRTMCEYWRYKGKMTVCEDQIKQIRAQFKNPSKADGARIAALESLARYYQGKYKEAATKLEQLIAQSKELPVREVPWLYLQIAWVQVAQQKYEAASESTDKFLKLIGSRENRFEWQMGYGYLAKMSALAGMKNYALVARKSRELKYSMNTEVRGVTEILAVSQFYELVAEALGNRNKENSARIFRELKMTLRSLPDLNHMEQFGHAIMAFAFKGDYKSIMADLESKLPKNDPDLRELKLFLSPSG